MQRLAKPSPGDRREGSSPSPSAVDATKVRHIEVFDLSAPGHRRTVTLRMERAGAWRHPGGPLLGKHKRKAHWFIASDDPYPWPDGERPPRHAWYVRHLDVLFTPPPDSCSLKQLVEQIERALAREPYPPQEAQNAC